MVSWNVGVALRRSGNPHWCVSREPDRCRPTVAAWFGTGEVSGSARSGEQPESDRYKESGVAISPHHVSGSRPIDLVALLGVKPAARRDVGRRTQPDAG